MRVIFVTVYSIILFLLCACKRQLSIDEMREATHQKCVGRWQLEKSSLQIFEPYYPTLKSETVYVGVADDFFHFKQNDSVSIGKAGQPVKEGSVYFNVHQLILSYEHDCPYEHGWFIDSLQPNRMILSWLGRYDDSTLRTRRETLYFTR